MTIVISIVIQMFCLVVIFLSVWVMICNAAAYRDINTFLTAIRYRPFSGPAILTAFQKVAYEKHMWARVFFRDPWRLYDPIVRAAIDNPVSELPVAEGVRIEIDGKGYASYGEQPGTKH